MKFVLLIWLAAIIKCNEGGEWTYCYPDSCRGERHTLCEYGEWRRGPECNRVITNFVTDEEKREILETHNMLRRKVAAGLETRGNPGPQPRGIIPDLRWDRRLAIIAQAWANQCIFKHDPCRDVKRFRVGQNVGYTGNSSRSFDKLSVIITNYWYDEVANFTNNLVKNYKGEEEEAPVYSHYTAIVWGSTRKIGCGLTRHFTNRSMYRTHLVCNYGPRGNWIGEPVYQCI
ncbi:GSCOCG00008320001-RA-CDS [Cotesia congregata]|nr:GSCOCG00008320001-RA-CDS [Cotesia congregata]